jgi:cell division protein FtsB
MPLIGAVQELSKQNNTLKTEIVTMKTQIDNLTQMFQNYISTHP